MLELRSVATKADRDFLFSVFASAQVELAAIPEPLRSMLVKQQFEAWRLGYSSQYGAAGLRMIDYDGSPVGYIWLHRNDSEFRIVDLAFAESARGKGLGGELVKRIAAEAWVEDKPLRASVAKSNEGSLRFNLRLGYVVTDESPTHWFIEWRHAIQARKVGVPAAG